MTDEDHEALADVLHQVEGAVVLSGYHSTLYDRLYADWDRVETTARADGNKKRTEVLWIKKVGRPEVNAPDGDGGLDPARLAPLQHPTSIPRQHQGPEGG
jgi:DNA adenine methylase